MENLSFKIKGTLLEKVLNVFVLGGLFISSYFRIVEQYKKENYLYLSLAILLFVILLFLLIYSYFRPNKTPDLTIDAEGIKSKFLPRNLAWDEIKDFNLDIGFISIRLIVNLNAEQAYISSLPFFKRMKAKSNIAKYRSPAVIDLSSFDEKGSEIMNSIQLYRESLV